jgi:hypothetical protein
MGVATAARCGAARSGISLAAASVMLRPLPDRRDVVLALLRWRCAERRPLRHQALAPVEKIGPVVGGHRLVAHTVRERHFYHPAPQPVRGVLGAPGALPFRLEARVPLLKGKLVYAAKWNVDDEADVAPIRALIDQGCDLEADVVPTVARTVPELPRPLSVGTGGTRCFCREFHRAVPPLAVRAIALRPILVFARPTGTPLGACTKSRLHQTDDFVCGTGTSECTNHLRLQLGARAEGSLAPTRSATPLGACNKSRLHQTDDFVCATGTSECTNHLRLQLGARDGS